MRLWPLRLRVERRTVMAPAHPSGSPGPRPVPAWSIERWWPSRHYAQAESRGSVVATSLWQCWRMRPRRGFVGQAGWHLRSVALVLALANAGFAVTSHSAALGAFNMVVAVQLLAVRRVGAR